jgi:ubiquinone/menaquinone biosynthesis C-methylase UbiE
VGLKKLLSGKRKPAKAKAPAAERFDPLAGLDIAPPPEAVRFDPGTWPMERLDVLERLWGRGNLIPGSHEDVGALMGACTLSSAKTMLEIGCGLGGVSRALVKKFGVWLVGLDRDENLVSEANRRSVAQKMEKKAAFFACDPETLSVKPAAYDAVLCRQMLSTVDNQDNLFDQFAAGLKASAHLELIDFVQGDVAGNEAGLQSLMDKERPKLHPMRAQQIAAALKKRHFLIHVAKDITEDYAAGVLSAWLQYRDTLKPGEVSGLTRAIVLDECERWTARMAALNSGALRVYRFHATNSAEKKKGSLSTLSDWKY